MESGWTTGPAKNLVEFARRAATPHAEVPPVELTIVTYHRGSGENALAANARQIGLSAVVLPERGALDTRVIPLVTKLVDEYKPDIVQTHNVKSHLFMRLTGVSRRYPWIAFNHGYTARDLRDKLYNSVDRWTLPSAFRVVAVCGPFADRLVQQGVQRSRIHIQHNSVRPFEGPDPAGVMELRHQLGLSGEPVVLAVGRLSSEKGHADLFEAIAIVARRKATRFRVVVAGDGPEHSNLVSAADRLGITSHVIMAGHRPDIRPFYALATVLALPSHSEGSPNVVLEAMTAGVPVAATRVGGVPEIIEDERTGLLVPPHAPEAMADALQRLLSDAARRKQLAEAAASEVQRRFTPDAYRVSLTTMYIDTLRAWAEQQSRK